MTCETPPEVTEDRILGGRVLLYQPRAGYRAAIDPVLLAAAVPARTGERVLDVGIGTGAAALCLAVRVPGCALVGVDRDPRAVRLARLSAAANGLDGRVTAELGEIPGSAAEGPVRGPFDHVMTNPPFLEPGRGRPSPDAARAAASVEGMADLAGWIRFCRDRLRPRGTLTMVHRADRLDALLGGLRGVRMGGIVVCPLWPGSGPGGLPARRVLVRARRDVATPLRLLPGLVLHEPDGRYTAAADSILRDACALDLGS